jgi:hypothetical protein
MKSRKSRVIKSRVTKSRVTKSRKSRVTKSRKSRVTKSRKSRVTKSRKSRVTKSRKSRVTKSRKSRVTKSKAKKIDIDEEDMDEDEDNEYLDIFMDTVDQLPFITYKEDIEAGEEPYTKNMFIEDIVNIIEDIYKQTNYVVVPDPETMTEIATIKFDNMDKKHNKEVNEFIFGTKKGHDSVFDKIRTFTRKIENKREGDMEHKYRNMKDDDILF